METQSEPQLLTKRDQILAEHVELIREQHSQFLNSAQTIGSGLLAAANHRRELGIKLQTLRDANYVDGEGTRRKVIGHGQWEALFSDHGNKSESSFAFTAKTANNYIEFGKKHPNKILDLKEVSRSGHELLLDAGEVEAATRESGGNRQPEGQAWLSGLSHAWERLTVRFEKKPLGDWTQTDRDTLKGKLKPMVELYARL